MANKAVVTPGQGYFAPGIVVRQSVLQDSTKDVSTTAGMEFVMGFPLCMGITADQGKLKVKTNGVANGDTFYGACASNINVLRGRVTLGESASVRGNAVLQGIVTVRKSVFLDSTNAEVTVNPFTGFTGTNSLPATTDIGKIIDAIETTSEAALGSTRLLKWGIGAGSSTGFADVAMILDVREAEEVDLLLTGKLALSAVNV